MSNTRHANGQSRFGGDLFVQAPEDTRQHSAMQLIGETVAVHVAHTLGELLKRMPWQPECEPCVVAAKTQIRAYEVLCRNALAAGEPNPDLPEPPVVATAVTWQDGKPKCFDHVETSSVQPVSAP